MAKKKAAKTKINKSQAIRDYKKANPSHQPRHVSQALGKKGIVVSAQFVSTIISTSKKKTGGVRKPGRPKGSFTRRNSGDVTFDSLLKVKAIVKEMGGVDKAKTALVALEQLINYHE